MRKKKVFEIVELRLDFTQYLRLPIFMECSIYGTKEKTIANQCQLPRVFLDFRGGRERFFAALKVNTNKNTSAISKWMKRIGFVVIYTLSFILILEETVPSGFLQVITYGFLLQFLVRITASHKYE